ncbi:MAG: response regulator [Desulfobacterales bacterium]|nr:response regulator [Desulfobacterales bacterium]MBF0396599.1 response regulator [Desulfobacterales bacterium]
MNIEKKKILIVDDERFNIDILIDTLKDYETIIAKSGEQAFKRLDKILPDLILLDIMMPEMDGYEVLKRLKAEDRTTHIPVIFITAMNEAGDETKGLEIGAIDYIAKPISPPIVRARVKNHLTLKNYRDHLEELVKKRTEQLLMTQDVAIQSMGVLAEYRDSDTGMHIKRTQNYIKILTAYLKHHPKFQNFLDDQTIELLYKSAPLHDIGKVGIPDHILLKPGKLTPSEFDEMKKHTVYGRDAIMACEKQIGSESFLRYAREIAYSHHEKWDGSGYPLGQKEDKIPISGRIMAIADVYDALISKRVYKPAFSHDQAVAIIKEGRGTHFDPDIVDVFLKIEEKFRQIASEFPDLE